LAIGFLMQNTNAKFILFCRKIVNDGGNFVLSEVAKAQHSGPM
jgi:hypothetical protein